MNSSEQRDRAVILTERRNGILLVVLNRPDRMNALNQDSFEALSSVSLMFRDDPSLRVMVVTGGGDRAFCAGIDLRDGSQATHQRPPGAQNSAAGESTQRRLQASLWTNNLRLYKPVIAAINGWCLAAGFELAMACDIRIVEEQARLGLPEVKRGLGAKATTHKLHFLAPLGFGLELAWTGDLLSPDRARALGLITEVVPSGGALHRAIELAETIAAMPPGYAELHKERLFQTIGVPLPYALSLAPREHGNLGASHDQ